MYVLETPNNDVNVVALHVGTITILATGLDFPPGGDCDLSGKPKNYPERTKAARACARPTASHRF